MRRFFVNPFFVSPILFYMCYCGGFVTSAVASEWDPLGHMSTERILEFSLSRLKASVEKTVQQNNRFTFENNALRESIEHLKRVREALIAKRGSFSGGFSMHNRQQKQRGFGRNINIENREQRVQNLVTIFKQDVMRLKEEIRIFGNELDSKQLDVQKGMLLREKDDKRKRLSRMQKKLNSFRKKNRKPLRTIEMLKVRRGELVQEVNMLENVHNRF